METSDLLNIGSELYNANLGQLIRNHCFLKASQNWELSKSFLPRLEFSINLLNWILVQSFIMPNLVN